MDFEIERRNMVPCGNDACSYHRDFEDMRNCSGSAKLSTPDDCRLYKPCKETNQSQEPQPTTIRRMFPVISSNIRKIGYSAEDMTLAVEFKNGVYHYPGFSAEKWAELCCCDSVGRYFHADIKSKYDSVKM